MASGAEELSREIEAAFAWRPRPGEDGNDFGGRHWREIIPGARDVEVRDRMGTLRHERFVYYLPAFLTLALDVDSYFEVGDRLVFQLWSFPQELSALLTPAERRAVVHVLQHLSDAYERRGYRGAENDAFVALDHYWAYLTDEELGSTHHDIRQEQV